MSDCEADVGEWRGHPHFTCERCNVRTISNAVLASRCQAARTPQPLTSTTGLLSATGEPFPQPDDTEDGELPRDGDTHD